MIVVLDLDNCIVDDEWRYSLIDKSHPKDERKWHEYHMASLLDSGPILSDAMKKALEASDDGPAIITSRPCSMRGITYTYLNRHSFYFSRLIMRPVNLMEGSVAFKQAAIMQNFNAKDIVAAFDDREDVVACYRQLGINAFVHAINERS